MEAPMRQLPLPARQQGIVIVVAMVMLVMMTLIAVLTFNMGRQNTIIAGNMQHKAEVLAAANQAVEEAISSTTFISNPAAALPGNKATYDVNGDGKDDVIVTLSPKPCVKKAQIIKNADLAVTNKNDRACIVGAGQPLGIEGAVTGDSLCSNSVWELNAVAADNLTGAETTVTTGVGVRVPADDAKNPANICS